MTRSSHLALAPAPSVAPRHENQPGSTFAAPRVPAEAPPHVQAAQAFAAARRSLGWSQDRVAIRLGVVRRTVMRWESGETDVPGWAIVALERRAA